MPALRNPRHEAFAQQLIHGQKHGWTRGGCYSRAGYAAEGHAADVAASRLLKNVENGIAARVAELAAAGARRAEITAASLIEKLDFVFDGATSEKQFSAAGRAVEAQAKIAGVMVDRVEVGAPGSFSEASMAETLQMVARELSPATATALSWLIDHDDTEMPVDEVARFTLAHITLDEALARQDRLRDALLRAASDGAVIVKAVAAVEPPRDMVDHQALAMWTQPKRPKGR